MGIYNLFFMFIAISLCQAGDIITKTGSSLQIQVETTNLNVLELGQSGNVYTRLPFGNEKIKITCTKLNVNQRGTLTAVVNYSTAPKLGNCQSYALNLPNAVDTCSIQAFEYTLNTDEAAGSLFQVLCQINETFYADAIGFNLFRLYADSIPRIRSGLSLDIPGQLTIHFTSANEPLSCEAIMDTTKTAQFDSINFYTYDSNQILNLPLSISNPTANTRNYSVAFDPNAIIRQIQLYKCCTTFQGVFVRCQGVYIINDLISTTPNSPCGGTTTTNGNPCTPPTTPCTTTTTPCTTTTTTTTPCITTPTPCTTTTTTTTPCITTPTPCTTTTTTTTPCTTTTTTTPCTTTTITTPCTTTTSTTPCTTTTTTPCPTTMTTTTTPCTTTQSTTTPCNNNPTNPTYRPSTRPWFCATCSSNTFEPKTVLFILLNLLVLCLNKF